MKTKTWSVETELVFNGQLTGHTRTHKVSTAAGLLRLVTHRVLGAGWGVRVRVPRALIDEMPGAYVTGFGDTLVAYKGAVVDCEVSP